MNRILQSILLSALVVSASVQANPFRRQFKHAPGVYLAWACAMGAVALGIGWSIKKLFWRTPARVIIHIDKQSPSDQPEQNELTVEPYRTITFEDATNASEPVTPPAPQRKYSDYELRNLRIQTTQVMPLFPGRSVNPSEEKYVDRLQQDLQRYVDDCGQNILDTLDTRRRELIDIQRTYAEVLHNAPHNPKWGYVAYQKDQDALKTIANAYAHAQEEYSQLVEQLISILEKVTIL